MIRAVAIYVGYVETWKPAPIIFLAHKLYDTPDQACRSLVHKLLDIYIEGKNDRAKYCCYDKCCTKMRVKKAPLDEACPACGHTRVRQPLDLSCFSRAIYNMPDSCCNDFSLSFDDGEWWPFEPLSTILKLNPSEIHVIEESAEHELIKYLTGYELNGEVAVALTAYRNRHE